VSLDPARTRRRRESRFGLDAVLVAERTINPPGDELDQFLGALERDALTGECTVAAIESSTVRAGEL
jgi:hypothetical protein